jgi:hypothetical protein
MDQFKAGDELVIEVTAEDIADGMRGECMWCPVAIAARRALGWSAAPSHGLEVVGDGGSHFVMIHGGQRWLLPAEATVFIGRFDTFHQVEPSTFTATLRRPSMYEDEYRCGACGGVHGPNDPCDKPKVK